MRIDRVENCEMVASFPGRSFVGVYVHELRFSYVRRTLANVRHACLIRASFVPVRTKLRCWYAEEAMFVWRGCGFFLGEVLFFEGK